MSVILRSTTTLYQLACSWAAMRSIASKLFSTSASVVAHDDTLIRIAVCPCQTVAPHQQVDIISSPGVGRAESRLNEPGNETDYDVR